MSLYLALAVWVALSFLATPVIGAIICRQLPDNRYCFRGDHAAGIPIVWNPRAIPRVEALGRHSAMAVRLNNRFSRPYGSPGRAIKPLLH